MFGAVLMLVAIGIAWTIDGVSGQRLTLEHQQQTLHLDDDATPLGAVDEEAGEFFFLTFLFSACSCVFVLFMCLFCPSEDAMDIFMPSSLLFCFFFLFMCLYCPSDDAMDIFSPFRFPYSCAFSFSR